MNKTQAECRDVLRNFQCEMRAREENGKGIVERRPIVYNKTADLGYFEEVIARGALDGADLKDVPFLVNHDLKMIPLARSRNNNENSTMRLMVDGEGLKIRMELDIENNAKSKSLYSAVSRGDIWGMSFMFNVKSEKWENEQSDYPKRTILEIEKVFEVSAVTFPAYKETEINARCKEELESYRSTLESVRSNALESGESVDDTLTLYKMKNRILGGI